MNSWRQLVRWSSIHHFTISAWAYTCGREVQPKDALHISISNVQSQIVSKKRSEVVRMHVINERKPSIDLQHCSVKPVDHYIAVDCAESARSVILTHITTALYCPVHTDSMRLWYGDSYEVAWAQLAMNDQRNLSMGPGSRWGTFDSSYGGFCSVFIDDECTRGTQLHFRTLQIATW